MLIFFSSKEGTPTLQLGRVPG